MTRPALETEPGFLLVRSMHDGPRLLKPTELAKALCVSPAVVSRWRSSGAITPEISEGKVIRFDLESVKAELKARARENNAR